VLALLVLGAFGLLTLTYGQSSGAFQRGVATIFSPFQSVADRALKPARDLVNWFDETFEARGENERLREELEKARAQAIAGQEALQQNAQLRKLVELEDSPPLASSAYEPVTTRVIARSPIVWHSTVTIDAGSGDGVRVDDPVLSGTGLVGRISSVETGSAQVMLLTDHQSAVSAKVLPEGVQGSVRPEIGNPEDLVLDFIDSTKRVQRGQAVVTSGWRAQGFASHFPAGLPLGEVTRAPVREQEASQQVHLRPYADLRNIDIVTVLTGGPR
jgi:rod shape-determining protein MreC